MKRLGISRQLWWLEVLVPMALAGAILFGFIYLIYSGQRHRRIASKIEERLIDTSMRFAGPAVPVATNWVSMISLEESDSREFPVARTKGIRDISIADYARVLTQILRSHPDAVYLAWLPSAHPRTESYGPLADAIREATQTKVVFGVPYDQIGFLPEELRAVATVVDADQCFGRIQEICTFDEAWTDWMPQYLANEYLKDPRQAVERGIISENLPRSQPSYLVYLQDLTNFERFTFSNFTRADGAPSLAGKAVFVGSDLFQHGKSSRASERDVGRVLTHISARTADVRISGTAMHVYWMQLAQMFKLGPKIVVISESVTWSIAGGFVIAIIAILTKFGAGMTLGFFLLLGLSAPYINGVLIRHLTIYIPVFDIIFSGIACFLISTFGKLSIDSYRQWIAKLERRQAEESRDLKGNFLSLISHNLNTPVAKMQGMLDIIENGASDDELRQAAKFANSRVAEIQLCIRTVLMNNAIAEASLNNAPLAVSALVEEFQNQMVPCLTRLGAKPTLSFGATEPDFMMLPLNFDKKAVTAAFGALSALFRGEGGAPAVMTIEALERQQADGARDVLRCVIRGEHRARHGELVADLVAGSAQLRTPPWDLLTDITIRLVSGLVSVYGGEIYASDIEGETVIEMFLTPDLADRP